MGRLGRAAVEKQNIAHLNVKLVKAIQAEIKTGEAQGLMSAMCFGTGREDVGWRCIRTFGFVGWLAKCNAAGDGEFVEPYVLRTTLDIVKDAYEATDVCTWWKRRFAGIGAKGQLKFGALEDWFVLKPNPKAVKPKGGPAAPGP